MAKDKKVAFDFQKLITEGRERKQAQELAVKVFRRQRVSSTLQSPNGIKISLASRAGVRKRLSSSAARPGSLAARIHAPGAPPASATSKPKAQHHTSDWQNALSKAEHHSMAAAQMSLANSKEDSSAEVGARRQGGGLHQAPPTGPARPSVPTGISIRGLAGPFVVLAQNFAPGTTAADIESAMMPFGGLINKCRILKVNPITIAEIEFETKEGADRVIQQFDNQLADGRVLHVYPKIGGATPSPARTPRAQASKNDVVLIDGSMGFEPMELEYGAPTGLYSDDLVGSASTQNFNRRGRGFRGGRSGSNWRG